MFESTNVLIVDGVEDESAKGGDGGLKFHIFVLLKRELKG